jgi:hypothetical protein
MSRRKLAVIGFALGAALAGFAVAVIFPSHGAGSTGYSGIVAPLFMIAAAVMVAAQRRRSEDSDG